MKKVVAILLAITLMSALFIVPAHAHEADEINPRAMLCDDPGGCNQAMAYRSKVYRYNYFTVPTCNAAYGAHQHYTITYLRYYICVNADCDYYNVQVPDTYYTSATEYCAG